MNAPLDPSAAVVIPVVEPLTNKVTVLPASAVPLIVGVVSFVVAPDVDITGASGAVVSITRALLSPKEPEAPGDAKVRFALFPAASLIVPLFNDSADVEAKSRSLAVSPA